MSRYIIATVLDKHFKFYFITTDRQKTYQSKSTGQADERSFAIAGILVNISFSSQRRIPTTRLVFELGARDHVTASLIQLHWLPVHWRIQFKLCCIMHSVFMANALYT